MIFKKNTLFDLISITFLLLLSVSIIFYKFADIPAFLHFDEIEFTKLALSLYGNGYIPYSPLATGHSTLYFYILLTSLKTFGITTFALRLPSAIYGIMNVIIFYFIFRIVFKEYKRYRYLPLLLSIVFISLRWYFNFARFSFEATFLIFLELASLLSMLWFKEKKKIIWLIISGIFAGLAYNSYTPGRFFIIIPLLFLLKDIPLNALLKHSQLKNYALFLIPFILLILPVSIYLTTHPDIRINQLSYLQNTELSVQEKTQFFFQNILSTLKMFHIKGDVNGVHNYPNKPALNPIMGLFFVVGLCISLLRWKRDYNLVFLAYFFLSLVPTLLTYPWENPHMLRTITAVPSIVYFVGVCFMYIIEKWKMFKPVIIPLLIVSVIISSLYELRTYFFYQKSVFEDAFRHKNTLQLYIDNTDIHPDCLESNKDLNEKCAKIK